jgi:hypothetical protein
VTIMFSNKFSFSEVPNRYFIVVSSTGQIIIFVTQTANLSSMRL